MLSIWDADHGAPVHRWRSWGDGPLTVARPIGDDRRPNGQPYPATAGWAIYHRRTGRVLNIPVINGRDEALRVSRRLTMNMGAVFWRSWEWAKLGNEFDVAPESIALARKEANDVTRLELDRKTGSARVSLGVACDALKRRAYSMTLADAAAATEKIRKILNAQ